MSRITNKLRNLLITTGAEDLRYRYYKEKHNKVYAALKAKFCRNMLYLSLLEVPITTCCTLCCKHCNNLIQYYKNPAHIPVENTIDSLSKILASTDGIANLHILGGEPLLHPELDRILEFCLKQEKICHIQILTNGTLLLPSNVIHYMENNSKVTVKISSYGEVSCKTQLLVEQMEKAHVQHMLTLGGGITWRALSDLIYRAYNSGELMVNRKDCFHPCLLNDELHVCHRSAHGTDLGVMPKREEDYVQISRYGNDYAALREDIYKLVNHRRCEACQYCYGSNQKLIKERAMAVPPGEQCTRSEARERFDEMMSENQLRRRNNQEENQ